MTAPAPLPAMQIGEIATLHWKPQCLYAATKLGIAELLASGPLTVSQLSAKAGANENVLGRLLRALSSIGIFAENPDGKFTHTPLSEVLQANHPHSARGMVLMSVDEWLWNAWGGLLRGVQTGEPPFEHLYKQSYFDHQQADPEREQVFADAMTTISEPQNHAVANAYPFNEIGTLVDVGGSNGHMLAAILRKHTALKGILFDLPGVIDTALTKGYITAPEVKDRIRVERGSALETAPKGADAYIFKSVIHDFDDQQSIRMLQQCRDAMAPNGRVLLAEMILKPRNEPDRGKFVDMCMFVLLNGQERSEEQYRSLLTRAGLRLQRVLPTASSLSILEAAKN